MPVSKEHVALQYERLVRHHDTARSRPNVVSLLDVTHCLRLWVEMKLDVDAVLTHSGAQVVFRHFRKSGSLKDILKDTPFTLLPLGSGWASPGVQIKGVVMVNRVLTPEEMTALSEMGPPRTEPSSLSFSQWLGTEVYEVRDNAGQRLGLSREVLVKRTANILGASHPMGADTGLDRENRFDPFIRDLHTLVVANMPATYYQVMEIAGDIIEALRAVFADSIPSAPAGGA